MTTMLHATGRDGAARFAVEAPDGTLGAESFATMDDAEIEAARLDCGEDDDAPRHRAVPRRSPMEAAA